MSLYCASGEVRYGPFLSETYINRLNGRILSGRFESVYTPSKSTRVCLEGRVRNDKYLKRRVDVRRGVRCIHRGPEWLFPVRLKRLPHLDLERPAEVVTEPQPAQLLVPRAHLFEVVVEVLQTDVQAVLLEVEEGRRDRRQNVPGSVSLVPQEWRTGRRWHGEGVSRSRGTCGTSTGTKIPSFLCRYCVDLDYDTVP